MYLVKATSPLGLGQVLIGTLSNKPTREVTG